MSELDKHKPPRRLPAWLKKKLPVSGQGAAVRKLLAQLKLNTVCREARCPNRTECFAAGVATFMILGDLCTRNCRFCAVAFGSPPPPRRDEPAAVAQACAALSVAHAVITSVARDDLDDGGAAHFAQTIRQVRSHVPGATIEVLVPDFQGSSTAIDTVLSARPDVFAHNIETVAGLYPAARPQADYRRSLDLLAYAKDDSRGEGGLLTKSGFMVGLGETDRQIGRLMDDLRDARVDMLTIGQYLAPSQQHLPVARFIPPRRFEHWEARGRRMGFAAVAAGPFVRSSYHAAELLRASRSGVSLSNVSK